MRNLIQFLLRYKDFFLFLTLQAFAFYFLFSANIYHHAVFATSANNVIGSLYQKKSDLNSYFGLREVNKKLAQSNKELLNRQRSSYRRVDNEYVLVDDTLMRIQYRYIPARVINSGISKQKNYITLNRGKTDGITPNMAVITEQGVVGITRHVSRHFTTVIPIINVAFELSVETKQGRHPGLIRWNGKDPEIANVEDMAKPADVQPGDTIVTRGSSAIFPQGIAVGTVLQVEDQPGSNFLKIKMKLANSYRSLNYVYVIQNTLRQEQLELEAIE